MKYSSGPQVPTMPKDGPNSVEVRSRAGDARQFSPSAARNCGPIREVLTRVLPRRASRSKIGSGTGEHVICFAKALPGLVWLPSDPDSASRASIKAWSRESGFWATSGRQSRRTSLPSRAKRRPNGGVTVAMGWRPGRDMVTARDHRFSR